LIGYRRIDGGSYGLRSGDQVDFNSTNYGDCDMTIYTNKDHSAFPFDDTQLISKLYSSDFEDIIANGKEFEFWSEENGDFVIYEYENKFKIEPDENERIFDAALRQITTYFQEQNQSLSKALSDLQREAIADEMSNLY
jgi:hypothetical protein